MTNSCPTLLKVVPRLTDPGANRNVFWFFMQMMQGLGACGERESAALAAFVYAVRGQHEEGKARLLAVKCFAAIHRQGLETMFARSCFAFVLWAWNTRRAASG